MAACAAGAPLDHANNLHWTAVIESIVPGDGGPRHQATLCAFIAAGADLRLADAQGNTPAVLARARGYAEMVRMFEPASGGGTEKLLTKIAPVEQYCRQ